jgi:hypothetical protein
MCVTDRTPEKGGGGLHEAVGPTWGLNYSISCPWGQERGARESQDQLVRGLSPILIQV